MASLVLLQDGQAIRFELSGELVLLGRHPDCGVQLNSGMISRRHARATWDGSHWYLEDLGSGNGTFLNAQRLEQPTRLTHCDRVKLGPLLLRYEEQEVSEPLVELPEDGGMQLPSQPNPFQPPAVDATLAPPPRASASPSETFQFNLSDEDEDSAQIMGSLENVGRFGMLDVQPDVKLKAVLEISRSLAGSSDVQALLPKILETLFRIFPHADRGSILLRDDDTGRMIPAAQRHRRDEEDSTVKLSRTILNKVLEDRQGILSADAASDSRFDASESISSLTIRSMMCVPMLGLEGEPTGVINIDTQNPVNQFRSEDLDLLMAVAGQAALSYESARLLASHFEKQKQDSEMQIARDVQRALLPRELPSVEGYDFFASYDSAQAVGGDYYDAFMLDDTKICLSFGDVAGKGVPGALIMSRMASVVQNTMNFTHDVGEAIVAINNHMCANAVEGRFVTYVLVVIDLTTHEMTLVNAGHMSPLIRRPDGTVDQFDEETIGIPVGIMEGFPFDVVSRPLSPGETVVIVTDGVDEAMDPEGNLYTKERVVEFVQNASPRADELGRDLLADVRRHANGREQNDDITIMAFSRSALDS
ncbi:MAG: SpoIIE family protein phosphatase [Planctomycetaceae bacterium]|nr:SpoIIE family protein phosphatase [Planctomycetaceae bacterium]